MTVSDGVYFDGSSSQRHLVTLAFKDWLEVIEDERTLAVWSYADIRQADSPSNVLRISCTTAPALARLEIRDEAIIAELVSKCSRLDENRPSHNRWLVSRRDGFHCCNYLVRRSACCGSFDAADSAGV